MNEKSVYIIDASSLIELERFVTKDFFSPLFQSLGSLISSESLISHEEVLKELKRKDGSEGEIYIWANKQKDFFKKIDERHIDKAREILQKFGQLIDPDKRNNADPFVIALALIKEKQQKLIPPNPIKYTIITEEVPSNNGGRPKIPDICKFYNIEHLNLNEFLKKELELQIKIKNNVK